MEREGSDLYGLPLDEFIPARTELERRLRKGGDRDRAAAVKKLPKPSVAAWAVNQASRSQPSGRRELLEASAALRETQERLIAGDASAADLERAAARQRAAIDALVDAASGLLTSDGKGLGDATLARVRETLAAVASDDELASLVESGTLDRERRPAGLGFAFAAPAADAPAAPAPEPPSARPRKKGSKKAAKPASKGAKPASKGAKARKERERAEKRRQKDLRAARERVKAATDTEREAARRQKAAEKDARKAAERLERAERAVEEARAAAGEARAAAEAAREELEAASAAQQSAADARSSAEDALEALG